MIPTLTSGEGNGITDLSDRMHPNVAVSLICVTGTLVDGTLNGPSIVFTFIRLAMMGVLDTLPAIFIMTTYLAGVLSDFVSGWLTFIDTQV